ncbi:MAG: bifunctional hydroxymethylpyrimidine kinase/phosphomethylpyrimidine kinase [Rhodospirillaceae bacterium]|nr:MAG: bifunctional hydroxymethylpyrimidine kinase/phosphomethylpyrimidine kinase [Rhodospirillaceae bacterium]
MAGRVLIIAGSDSGGGAGIQADIKTVTSLGGYAMTAITAVTVQNTLGVSGVHEIPPAVVAAQLEAVLSDIGADVIKTGMLASAEIIAVVSDVLDRLAPTVPRVIDPVMQASAGGRSLLLGGAADSLRRLIAGARLVTPNLPEAEILTGRTIRTLADMDAAVPALRTLGAQAVLLKGGHVEGNAIVDLLIEGAEVIRFADARIVTSATHGTGCTLASAIAAGLADGLALPGAVARARAYVRQAILTAPGLGKGASPLNHGHTINYFQLDN